MITFGGVSPIGFGRSLPDLLRASQRLASGNRIVQAADDAAGLSIAERLRALEASIDRGVHNLSDGGSLAQVAEGGLASISDSVIRMRELSLQAQNGTLTTADRDLIQIEFDQLAADISSVAGSTEFNGHDLLDGDIAGSSALKIVDHLGDDLELALDDHSAQALGIDGLSVGDSATLTALDDALSTVSRSRTDVGALQNRIDSRVQDHRQRSLNIADARSRIADTDFAAETANLSRSRLLAAAEGAIAVWQRRGAGAFLDLLG